LDPPIHSLVFLTLYYKQNTIPFMSSRKYCLYLPEDMIERLKSIKEKEKITQSHQVELALGDYFKKYKNIK